MVDETQQRYLSSKATGEIRQYDPMTSMYEKVGGHANPQAQFEVPQPSRIWAEYSFLPFGDSSNLEPRFPSGGIPSPSALVDQTQFEGGLEQASSSLYLRPTENRQIENWAKTIAATMDPNNITAEPVKQEKRRGRKVRADSDDDSPSSDAPPDPTSTASNAGVLQPSNAGPSNTSADHETENSQSPPASDGDCPTSYPAIQSPSEPNSHEGSVIVDSTDEMRSFFSVTSKTRADHEADAPPAVHDPTLTITPLLGASETLDNGDGWTTVAERPKRSKHVVINDAPPVPSLPPDFDHNKWRGRASGRGNTSMARRGNQQVSNRPKPTKGISQGPVRGKAWAATLGFRSRGQGQVQARGSKRGPASGRATDSAQLPDTLLRGGQPLTNGQQSPGLRKDGRRAAQVHVNARNDGHVVARSDELIQLDTSFTFGVVAPPPGFDCRPPNAIMPTSSETLSLLDAPTVKIEQPSLMDSTVLSPSRGQLERDVDSQGATSATSSNEVTPYLQTHHPIINWAKLQKDKLEELQAMIDARKEHGAGGSATDNVLQQGDSSMRKYHRTMDQHAPNPGKKGTQQKQVSKQEIARRKQEILGDFRTQTYRQKSEPVTSAANEPMSARKRQILKEGGKMSESDRGTAELELRLEQARALLHHLSPVLHAARAFSGKLTFEIQFGQILVPHQVNSYPQQYQTIKEWNKKFNPSSGPAQLSTSFTNILTCNGGEIDRLLEMKEARGAAKMWNKTKPGPSEVTYEFQCQTRENDAFWLVCDQQGKSTLCQSQQNISMVNLHCPESIWDFCAVVSGVPSYCASGAVADGVSALAESLHLQAGLTNINITYREPSNNEMSVRDVVMKRKSLHNCLALDKHDFQLQITEVQTLFQRSHAKDKKLCQAFAKAFDEMHTNGRIHYEVALVHKDVNNQLLHNMNLELGELTSAWSENSLLTQETVTELLEVATHVVVRMDYVGANNFGTLARLDSLRDYTATKGLPSVGVGVQGIGMAPSARTGVGLLANVPGVRAGTTAEVVDGAYLRGYGGARVPIAQSSVLDGREMGPLDSASQAGGGRDGGGGGAVQGQGQGQGQ